MNRVRWGISRLRDRRIDVRNLKQGTWSARRGEFREVGQRID